MTEASSLQPVPGRQGDPARRPLIRHRIVVLSVAAILSVLAVYLPLTLLAPLAPTSAQLVPFIAPDRTATHAMLPGYGASAVGAIGYPEAFASAGSTEPLPIASISKIVTSLVVLEAKPLSPGDTGPTITFTARDAALRAEYVALNGETKPLTAGTSISQLDLMRVTLVASANNYADALAGWAFGSRAAFEIAVSAWLSSHGLDHTIILEPTGINPGNVSTATDLVEIGKLALANPVVASIVSTESMTLADVGSFANTNTMLGRLGVTGIKTGTLGGLSNLLFAATFRYRGHAVTVVGAVIGGANHKAVDATVTILLEGMKAGFHEITLATRGEAFANFTAVWSQKARAVSSRAASILVWSNTPVTAVISALPARVGGSRAAIGSVTFTAGSQSVIVVLTLDQRLVDPGPWWRLSNPAKLIG